MRTRGYQPTRPLDFDNLPPVMGVTIKTNFTVDNPEDKGVYSADKPFDFNNLPQVAPAKKSINAKAKGTKAEHKVMVSLTTLGYACCRSAASLGAFDVIAVRHDQVLFVQVKAGVHPTVPPAERRAMLAVPMPANCYRLIWKYYPGGKHSCQVLTEGDKVETFYASVTGGLTIS